MRLARLTADFLVTETRLAHAIKYDSSIANRVILMRRATDLMDQIEAYVPDTEQCMRYKIDFFLDRARRGHGKRELGIALELIALAEKTWPRTGVDETRSAPANEVFNRLIERGCEKDELISYITNLGQRASLLGLDYRHLCTSRGNRHFHNQGAAYFNNMHMGDLVGPTRFLNRSRKHMDDCLNGTPQCYSYVLKVPALGTRVLQCHMRPWRLPSGERGGLAIWMDDITNTVTRRHGFGDIPTAWPDHNIDGTT